MAGVMWGLSVCGGWTGLDRVGWAGAARVIGPERATAKTQGRLGRRQQNKQECLDRICNRAGRATVLLEATCGGERDAHGEKRVARRRLMEGRDTGGRSLPGAGKHKHTRSFGGEVWREEDEE